MPRKHLLTGNLTGFRAFRHQRIHTATHQPIIRGFEIRAELLKLPSNSSVGGLFALEPC